MNNIIVKEINDFKYEVTNNGMYMREYLSRKKHLMDKIESSSEKYLNFFRYLFFKNMITHEQYFMIKAKIEETRKSQKFMLSFY